MTLVKKVKGKKSEKQLDEFMWVMEVAGEGGGGRELGIKPQSVSQSVSLSVSHEVGQSISQSVSHAVGLAVVKSVC